jgi:TatD DNase family protein
MQLTDTHTHLHFENFSEDLPAVIARAETTNVYRILTLGTDLDTSRRSLDIANRYDFIYAAAGIHPSDVYNCKPNHTEKIHQLAEKEPKIVAIGEIGLDLYWKDVPLRDQLPVFSNMLEVARQIGLPVVIHNRDAHREMKNFFKETHINKLSGVMHSFSGSIEDADFYLDMGLYISFTGLITFKNFKNYDVVKSVPAERLLLETDSPFLAPVPRRGKRNEPSFVKYVAEKVAELHGIPTGVLADITFRNAHQLFKWMD